MKVRPEGARFNSDALSGSAFVNCPAEIWTSGPARQNHVVPFRTVVGEAVPV